jgi:Rrf2 family protein
MKLSTAVRYGARAIARVASVYPQRAMSVREVAEHEKISAKYLEHIFRPLKAAGLIRAVRGKQGGYVLAKPPQSITLRDVYESLDGSTAPVDCVDCPELCAMHRDCPTRDTWVELQRAIATVLGTTTIQDLVDRQKRAQVPPSPLAKSEIREKRGSRRRLSSKGNPTTES